MNDIFTNKQQLARTFAADFIKEVLTNLNFNNGTSKKTFSEFLDSAGKYYIVRADRDQWYGG